MRSRFFGILVAVVIVFAGGMVYVVANGSSSEFLENGSVVQRTKPVEGYVYELNQPTAISWKADPSDGVEKFEVHFGGKDRNMFPYYVDKDDIRRNTKLCDGCGRWVRADVTPRRNDAIEYSSLEYRRVFFEHNARNGQLATAQVFRGGRNRGR